jgi:hypothetical protein
VDVNCSIIINDGENIITNPQIVSDRFNTFFQEVIEELLSQSNYHCLRQNTKFKIKNCSETMFIAPVTETEVEQTIKGLKTNSAAGFDEIPVSLVKQCLGYFVKPLVHIYNVSFQTGIFPDIMKKAKIRPLFKKGDKQDVQNYRPISILSAFSKILEILIYYRLLSFLMKHDILTNVQHGFMVNRSTETASQLFIESVQEALDRNLHVIGIFLDLSKVYDVLNHSMLLDKLDLYGVRGSANKWFKSYLTNRTQFVEISHTDGSSRTQRKFQSSPRVIAHGVPKGSIWDPFCFWCI